MSIVKIKGTWFIPTERPNWWYRHPRSPGKLKPLVIAVRMAWGMA